MLMGADGRPEATHCVCPVSSVQCPVSSVQCPVSSVQCLLPSAHDVSSWFYNNKSLQIRIRIHLFKGKTHIELVHTHKYPLKR